MLSQDSRENILGLGSRQPHSEGLILLTLVKLKKYTQCFLFCFILFSRKYTKIKEHINIFVYIKKMTLTSNIISRES